MGIGQKKELLRCPAGGDNQRMRCFLMPHTEDSVHASVSGRYACVDAYLHALPHAVKHRAKKAKPNAAYTRSFLED